MVRISITPGTASGLEGDTVRFRAVARDASDSAVDVPIAWSVSPPARAQIDSLGLVTLADPGLGVVRASAAGITDSAAVSVAIISGARAAFVMGIGASRPVYLAHRDGSDPQRVSPASVYVIAYAWSPTRDRIAALYDQDRALHVTTLDGTEINRLGGLATPVAGATELRWSQDGTQILFVSSMPDGVAAVYTMRVADGVVARIDSASGTRADWSPDGASIVYTVGSTVRVATRDGSSHRVVYTAPAGTTKPVSPAWSPPGNYIAFDNGNIWVMAPDGSGARQLTPVAGCPGPVGCAGVSPTWAPDGSLIAFFGNLTLQVIAPDGTGSRVVSSSATARSAWSPAGDQILATIFTAAGLQAFAVGAGNGQRVQLSKMAGLAGDLGAIAP